MSRSIYPGEIYEFALGEEESHYAIVVSQERFNRGKYLIVVPITSKRFTERKDMPNCVPFTSGQYCFTMNCVARAERMALVEKTDLRTDAGPIDTLDGQDLWMLVKAIGVVIGAECVPLGEA